MGPLLTAGLLASALAAAEPPVVIPDASLDALRGPFALGQEPPSAPPSEPRLGYDQMRDFLALVRRIEAVQERRAPADPAGFEAFLAAYVDEIEGVSAGLRLPESLRERARKTYLSRLSRPDLPPDSARLLAGFLDPARAEPAARERARELLARRAVGNGPRLPGASPFGSRQGETLPSAGALGTALAVVPAGRLAQPGAMRTSEFQPQRRFGPVAAVPGAAPAPSARPTLMESARAMLAVTGQTLSAATPENHGMAVFSEAERRVPGVSSHNTEQDAWRHTRWNQRMVTDPCGGNAVCKVPATVYAFGLGTLNELVGAVHGQPWEEFKMDFMNNMRGIAAGWRTSDPAEIDRMVERGEVTVITRTGAKPKPR